MNFKFFKLNIRFLPLFIFLVVILPVVCFFLFNSTTKNVTGIINNNIKNTIQVVAFEQEGWMYRNRQLLAVLAVSPEVRVGGEECSNFLKKINDIYPKYLLMGVASLDGNIFCSTVPFEGEVNISDRDYFKDAILKKDFSVGDYQIGRITKEPTLNFGYPILDNKGKIKDVLFTALDLNWVKDLIGEINLPPGITIKIIDKEGLVLSGIPESENDLMGKKVPETDLLDKVLNEETGTYETTGIDGIKRLYSFTSLNGAFIIIGIPLSYIHEQTFTVLLPYLIVFLVTALGILVLFWRKKRNYTSIK